MKGDFEHQLVSSLQGDFHPVISITKYFCPSRWAKNNSQSINFGLLRLYLSRFLSKCHQLIKAKRYAAI